MAKNLHKGSESGRRSKIIAASRAADPGLLPQLLARLEGKETLSNKRHVVRSLGNIGGPTAEAKLLALLNSQSGVILGDIAHALGKLRVKRAAGALKELSGHKLEWVRQNVAFALGRMEESRD
jgi:HEAT repeat protein